jgi:GTP-binding protein EngB required for normal cell division
MKFDITKLCISHSLQGHPIQDEDLRVKKKYLNLLENFTLLYSKDDEFAHAMLENYKQGILKEKRNEYFYTEIGLKLSSKGLINTKLEGYKLFTYRYALMCDCLFINAFAQKAKGLRILDGLKRIYKPMYRTKMEYLFKVLYEKAKLTAGFESVSDLVRCWKTNLEFIKRKQRTILITASMSAGKSTLINAITGKTVNRTMNEACTGKLHYIYEKAYEDFFNYEFDHELNLNADHSVLMKDNELNTENKIAVATYFRILSEHQSRLCIIDTPGVNSYLNPEHAQITKSAVLEEKYDKLLYVINAENAGTDDDLKYLSFISDNVDKNKVIFALNKLDKFRSSEDSISESIEHITADLKKIGYDKPVICPISSYMGSLAKKIIFGEELSEDDYFDYEFLKRKFNKEEYNLSKYYPRDIVDRVLKDNKKHSEKNGEELQLLLKSGLLCLEQILTREEEK